MIFRTCSRRDFVKTVTLGTAALSFGCVAKPEEYIAPIGVQLYSVRDVIFDDLAGTIKKIADMGYMGVETWGGLTAAMDVKEVAKIIQDAGLQVLGCHVGLPVAEKRDNALQMAEAYKTENIIFPGALKYGSTDELKQSLEQFNSISDDLKKQGLKFGLHNHRIEFKINSSDVMPFYYLLENASQDIFFEIDTYWAQTAGFDPARAIKDFGSRAPFLHIKDGSAKEGTNEHMQVPAGKGALDFPAIVKAGGNNIQWMIVEFDNTEMDIFAGIQQSYSYLTKNKLARGNE